MRDNPRAAAAAATTTTTKVGFIRFEIEIEDLLTMEKAQAVLSDLEEVIGKANLSIFSSHLLCEEVEVPDDENEEEL